MLSLFPAGRHWKRDVHSLHEGSLSLTFAVKKEKVITIKNSYFSDYRRTIQMVSKYTPLFLVPPHEAVQPLLSWPPWWFFSSGTVA